MIRTFGAIILALAVCLATARGSDAQDEAPEPVSADRNVSESDAEAASIGGGGNVRFPIDEKDAQSITEKFDSFNETMPEAENEWLDEEEINSTNGSAHDQDLIQGNLHLAANKSAPTSYEVAEESNFTEDENVPDEIEMTPFEALNETESKNAENERICFDRNS